MKSLTVQLLIIFFSRKFDIHFCESNFLAFYQVLMTKGDNSIPMEMWRIGGLKTPLQDLLLERNVSLNRWKTFNCCSYSVWLTHFVVSVFQFHSSYFEFNGESIFTYDLYRAASNKKFFVILGEWRHHSRWEYCRQRWSQRSLCGISKFRQSQRSGLNSTRFELHSQSAILDNISSDMVRCDTAKVWYITLHDKRSCATKIPCDWNISECEIFFEWF